MCKLEFLLRLSVMDFWDPATKCFPIYHLIPKKKKTIIMIIVVLANVEVIITHLQRNKFANPTRFTSIHSKETK